MAYEWNTPPCLQKMKCNPKDLLHSLLNQRMEALAEKYPLGLLADTWKTDTPPKMSSLCVPLHLENNCSCPKSLELFPPKHWPVSCLNYQIKTLLRYKVIHHMLQGHSKDTFLDHSRHVLREIVEWLYLPETVLEDENEVYKENLMKLFAQTATKHYAIKEMPQNQSEWVRLLSHWLRQNTCGETVKERNVYVLLAVDGFLGFRANELKKYFPHILVPLRKSYRLHVRAVRTMYDWLDRSAKMSSLTGTDSACVVFLALLKWYETHLIIHDQLLKMRLCTVQMWVEGILHQHTNYYDTLRHINEALLEDMGKEYGKQFEEENEWKVVGMELVSQLEHFFEDEKPPNSYHRNLSTL